jgi:hypothetical protein
MRDMFNTFKVLIATTTLTATMSAVPTFVEKAHADPRVVLTGMTADERAMTMHAISLFEQAHLPLPPLVIRRHHDQASCGGRDGRHTARGRQSIVDICTSASGSYERHIIIHELAHAWTSHLMTTSQRQAFQRLRGWTTWNEDEGPNWKDNGSEQAAEIIVWGLSDHPVAVFKIHKTDCVDLFLGYWALTGMTPLHGYRDMCHTWAPRGIS